MSGVRRGLIVLFVLLMTGVAATGLWLTRLDRRPIVRLVMTSTLEAPDLFDLERGFGIDFGEGDGFRIVVGEDGPPATTIVNACVQYEYLRAQYSGLPMALATGIRLSGTLAARTSDGRVYRRTFEYQKAPPERIPVDTTYGRWNPRTASAGLEIAEAMKVPLLELIGESLGASTLQNSLDEPSPSAAEALAKLAERGDRAALQLLFDFVEPGIWMRVINRREVAEREWMRDDVIRLVGNVPDTAEWLRRIRNGADYSSDIRRAADDALATLDRQSPLRTNASDKGVDQERCH